ncbi:MAG: protein-export chaperone SecB [Gammaproteobacteria bacterium]|nr:protein-export chaperone SecB [Gammaproteobacteria bacterium]
MSEQAANNPNNPQPQVRLERIYLKDSSFESPGTPDVFGEEWKPEINVDIGTKANTGPSSRFEVVLSGTIRAKRANGKTAFIVEVQQAGLFFIQGLSGDMLQMALGTVCPTTLFPYLRETVDNLVVKGGFPALHLAPVNFDALFRQAVAERQAQQAGKEPGEIKH